jgi:hypothetical protein
MALQGRPGYQRTRQPGRLTMYHLVAAEDLNVLAAQPPRADVLRHRAGKRRIVDDRVLGSAQPVAAAQIGRDSRDLVADDSKDRGPAIEITEGKQPRLGSL